MLRKGNDLNVPSGEDRGNTGLDDEVFRFEPVVPSLVALRRNLRESLGSAVLIIDSETCRFQKERIFR